MLNRKLILMILNFLFLGLVIVGVSVYFVFDEVLIGYVLLLLFCFCLFFLKIVGVKIRTIKPDIVFGFIDNSILVLLAVFGGHIGGVAGAIIGGAVGNALTDGIAGIFEGIEAEKIEREDKKVSKSIFGMAVGKMAGCLLGAGVVLVLAHWFGW